MKDCIKESIDLFGEELITKVSSPEKKVLQNIYKNSTRLENKDVDIIHYIFEKLLWSEKGEGPTLIMLYRSCAIELPRSPRRTRRNLGKYYNT